MTASRKSQVYLSSILLAALSLCGCQPEVEVLKPCPASTSVTAAIAGLNARTVQMRGLKASGRCTIEFHEQDGKKRREAFPVMIRTQPPHGLYFQGNLIIPKGIVLGTNDQEFWLGVKLKEVDSFWYGPVAGCSGAQGLLISPSGILEALGYVQLDPQNAGGYAMKHESPYDVVTMLDDGGRLARKIYLYSCDATPRKIEYYGEGNRLLATTIMGHYESVTGWGSVPTQIEMTFMRKDGSSDKLSITLETGSLDVFEPTERQMSLFAPDSNGIKHIYRLTEGCTFEEIAGQQR